MDELIAFMRRCLDDDERVAREITAPEWSEGCSWLADLRDPLPSQRRAYGLPKEWQMLTEADTRHIARWDPARVLAEVDAKRRILAWLADAELSDGTTWSFDGDGLLRLLAQPYAGRDGWREEWRLDGG